MQARRETEKQAESKQEMQNTSMKVQNKPSRAECKEIRKEFSKEVNMSKEANKHRFCRRQTKF